MKLHIDKHMSQIAEEPTFAVLSVTKSENSRCSWDFLEVSQEANVAPFLSSWTSTATTMSFGHRGYLKNAKKWPFSGTILNFHRKLRKQAILFPKFLHENKTYRTNKVYHNVADGKCHAMGTKKMLLNPSYGV